MKQKKGFIAVSLIYSFFLVFLMIILATTVKSAQTRQLLKVYKDDIKQELNQTEFIVTKLPKENTYEISKEIDFIGDTWQVVENKENSVVLILKRALNMEEITEALGVKEDNTTFFQNSCNQTSCKVKMCTSAFSTTYCYYENSNYYYNYQWKYSIGKYILEHWLEKNTNLQKICRLKYDEVAQKRVCTKDTLMEMTFQDGVMEQKGYIRLATKDEVASNPAWATHHTDSWTLTKEKVVNGKNYVYSFTNSKISNETALELRPVIEVRKS